MTRAKFIAFSKKCAMLLLFFIIFTIQISAHPGRTDANGGHWDRSAGTYHYHTGEYAGRNSSGDSSSYSNTKTHKYNIAETNENTIVYNMTGIAASILVLYFSIKISVHFLRKKARYELSDLDGFIILCAGSFTVFGGLYIMCEKIIPAWFHAITTPTKELTSIDMIYIIITIIICVVSTILINVMKYKKHQGIIDKLSNSYALQEKQLQDSKKSFELYRKNEMNSLKELRTQLISEHTEKEFEAQKSNLNVTSFNTPISPSILMQNSVLYDYCKDTMTFKHIANNTPLDYNRLYHYIADEANGIKHEFKSIYLSATLSNPKSDRYETTLNYCTCPDFSIKLHKREPCKHMYMLAYELMLLNSQSSNSIKAELEPYAIAYKERRLSNRRTK